MIAFSLLVSYLVLPSCFSQNQKENLTVAQDYLTCSQLKSTCVNSLLESSVVLLRLVERSAYSASFQDVYTHRVSPVTREPTPDRTGAVSLH